MSKYQSKYIIDLTDDLAHTEEWPMPYYDYIKAKKFKFPAGEVHTRCQLPWHEDITDVLIAARLRTSDDIMELLQLTSIVREHTNNISLFIPWVPFARYDRKMEAGDCLPIKVFADLINAQNYKRVFVFNTHSFITLALINNCIECFLFKYINEAICNIEGRTFTKETSNLCILASPDDGARKKVDAIAKYYDRLIVNCDKVRDNTGKIINTKVDLNDVEPKDKQFLIVDDICDGGATFIPIAAKLKELGAKTVSLYVTHGIFSKGFEPLIGKDAPIDKIFTTNSFSTLEIPKEYKTKIYQYSLTSPF